MVMTTKDMTPRQELLEQYPLEIAIALEVDSKDYGDLIAIVPVGRNPIWHGAYETGTLTLHLTDILGEQLEPVLGLIFVITDKYDPEMQILGYTMHPANCAPEDCISAALKYIGTQYVEMVSNYTSSGVSSGEIKLQ